MAGRSLRLFAAKALQAQPAILAGNEIHSRRE
jgi:hypothetical protein